MRFRTTVSNQYLSKNNMRYREYTWRIILTTLLLHVEISSSAVSSCGGTLNGSTGTFTSPNYPHSPKREPEAAEVRTSLSNNQKDIITCEWRIIVPEGFGIQLNFGDFDMAAGLDECGKGELEVFSGVDDERKSLDKYCGSDDLDTVTLQKNSATVIFRRPKEFSGKGFLVSYIATTPGETIDDFVTCNDRGSDHIGADSYSVLCAGGCANITDLSVRGKNSYRDDSFLCKAAVHAGVISDRFGGRIKVKRVPGEDWYMSSEANGISTSVGAMSDTQIQFVRPDEECRTIIKFYENQLTASSFWTKDPDDADKTKWKPDNAILGKQVNAWSPNNPTSRQWLQVDLREMKVITAILTRGSMKSYFKSESYRIAYRNDTRTSWTFYKEEGMTVDKVFVGNQHTFKETRNNFIRPKIVARFFRIYPTPVSSENYRYSLQIALHGCDADALEAPVEPPIIPPTISTTITPKPATEKTTVVREESISTVTVTPIISPGVVNQVNSTGSRATNGSLVERDEFITDSDGVIKEPVSPTDTKKPTMSENSIIVIAIVAALGVTSMLLAALVLLLVKKRKKDPKDGPPATYQMQQIQDNNNTGYSYKKKKSRKRSRKATGEHFQNADYNALLQVPGQPALPDLLPSQGVTLPADQARFISGSQQNGSMPAFMRNGIMPQHNSFHPPDETDSFITDDEDHEYQVIPDEMVVSNGRTPVPSMGRGSSKASTGSSMGNHSRKSDTNQRWGTDGNQWNKATYGPNSPIFSVQQHNGNQHNPNMSSFTTGSHPPGTFSYPNGPQNHQVGRSNTFHESRNSPINEINSHARRGSSQSPSHVQRHSSSSNNSSHSYPINGVSYHPQEPANPYYSSVPSGESNNPAATNHVMYGGHTIPEQNELPASASKRAPSYKVPKQFNTDRPALPEKVGNAISQGYGPNPSIGVPGRGASPTDPSTRSDYDRLYRNNSSGGVPEQKNNFSIVNGSHSQYNQLELNGARV